MIPCLMAIESYLETLTARADLPILEELLASLRFVPEEFKDVALFHDKHYQRNHISGSDWYDLFLMCWKPGQSSAIHDHAGSSCALKIVSGTATETGYALSKPDSPLVIEGAKRRYFSGSLCLAQDGEIHRISNDSPNENLMTIHIYSPPLRMNVYEIDPISVGAIPGTQREASRHHP